MFQELVCHTAHPCAVEEMGNVVDAISFKTPNIAMMKERMCTTVLKTASWMMKTERGLEG